MGVVAFIKTYADDAFKIQINGAGKKIQIKYLDYNWSLNGR